MKTDEIKVANNISLTTSGSGMWVVMAKDKEIILRNFEDYFRVWLLLERPYSEVKEELDRISLNAKAAPFPIAFLVGSALESESAYWPEQALKWIQYLSSMDKRSIQKSLAQARANKRVSQRSRQLADKYIREIERDR